MDLPQIDKLRETVRAGHVVLWVPEDGSTVKKIRRVPDKEEDPDKTGVTDFIAVCAGGGHLDLSDIAPMDFFIAKSLF